jgi:hypothetical protein
MLSDPTIVDLALALFSVWRGCLHVSALNFFQLVHGSGGSTAWRAETLPNCPTSTVGLLVKHSFHKRPCSYQIARIQPAMCVLERMLVRRCGNVAAFNLKANCTLHSLYIIQYTVPNTADQLGPGSHHKTRLSTLATLASY